MTISKINKSYGKTALLILGLNAALTFNNSVNANDSVIESCKSNVLHYAASINDLKYFNDLLNMNTFTLTDLNHNCDTAYHIAIQNGNIDILKSLFSYIPIQDAVFNKNGENLIQYSIKHNQPEILVFLINNGLDPHSVSKNNKTGIDYQSVYGNDVTDKIISDYDRTQLLMHVSNEKSNYQILLKELQLTLKQKEDKIIEDIDSSESDLETLKSQHNLRQEVLLLKNQINFLTNIIDQKNGEISRLRNLLKESNISEESINKNDSGEGFSEFELDALFSDESLLKDVDSDIINEGGNRIFEIFSRPIYKIQDKE